MAKDKKKCKAISPSDEQLARYSYALEAVTDQGQVIGRAYRRRPLFQTMLSRGEISHAQHYAISFYVEQHNLSNRSLTRDSLAPFNGSGDGSGILPCTLRGASEVRIMDKAMGALANTFKAVVIDDDSFNRIAIARWGSKQHEFRSGKTVRQIIGPKSRTHPRRIKDEFCAALELLMPIAYSMCAVNYSVDLCDHTKHKTSNLRSASTRAHNAPRAEKVSSLSL